MRVLLDVFSGDEIVTDAFVMEELYENTVGVVKSQYVVKGGLKVDIGCGNAFGGTGEDEEEKGGPEGEPQEDKVNDVLDNGKYNETTFSKAEYTAYIKGYMKRVKEHLEKNKPDRVAGFMKGAQEMIKWVLTNFTEFQFYTPESYNCENIIILAMYPEGAECPTFYYFLDGLREEKY